MNNASPPAPRSRSVSQSRSVTRPRLFNRPRSTTPRPSSANRPRSTISRPANFNRSNPRPIMLTRPLNRPQAAIQPRLVTRLRALHHPVVNRQNPAANSQPIMRAPPVARTDNVNPPLPSNMNLPQTPTQLIVILHNYISNVAARNRVNIHEIASDMPLFHTSMLDLDEFHRYMYQRLLANPN